MNTPPSTPTLSDSALEQYLLAAQTGDPRSFDYEDPWTHPDFDESLIECDWATLKELELQLKTQLLSYQKAHAESRHDVEWDQEAWDERDRQKFAHYQQQLTHCDRFNHLLQRLREVMFEKKALERKDGHMGNVEDLVEQARRAILSNQTPAEA